MDDIPHPNQATGGQAFPQLRDRVLRAVASISLIAIFSTAFAFAPYNRELMDRLYGGPVLAFTGWQFLVLAAGSYALLVFLYDLLVRTPVPSKSVRFYRVVQAFLRQPAMIFRQRLGLEDRVALLATLLKGFFAPLMLMSLMTFCVGAAMHARTIFEQMGTGAGALTLFDQHGFWMLMQTILFIDVLIFTVGYLIEMPRLGNEIRSVDPTLLGWAAALLCYPPFNAVTSMLLGSQVSDFPQFDDPAVHVVLNIALLALLACYSWASVALGLKASNLTHRGIVRRGPYALVRHPAYVCKNLAWWIGSVPLVMSAWESGAYDGIKSVASVAGWTMLYVLRALTEEDHLRSVNDEYTAYAGRVRYRFVPGIY